MDVTKPEVSWVQGTCFTRNDVSIYRNERALNGDENQKTSEYSESKPYEEIDDDGCDAFYEETTLEYSIEETSAGFEASCTSISSRFFPIIIGPKGSTRIRLENETGAEIILPGRNGKGSVVVRGKLKKTVLLAVRRLDVLCAEARLKLNPTHFLCFPLNEPEVVRKCVEFKEAVLKLLGSRGDESIFLAPQKLHLTINVLVLLNGTERHEASKFLDHLRKDIRQMIGSEHMRVNLKGLGIMNNDPLAVHVLYAKVNTPDDTLQRIADFVDRRYQSTGNAKRTKGAKVKLHATLMNTKYRSKATSENVGRWYKRQSFNAREILERFEDYDFGTVEVKEIRISAMHATDKDGFYQTLSNIYI